MQIDLKISIALSDRPRDRDKIRAARQVMLMMAAEIIRVSASWDDKEPKRDPPAE